MGPMKHCISHGEDVVTDIFIYSNCNTKHAMRTSSKPQHESDRVHAVYAYTRMRAFTNLRMHAHAYHLPLSQSLLSNLPKDINPESKNKLQQSMDWHTAFQAACHLEPSHLDLSRWPVCLRPLSYILVGAHCVKPLIDDDKGSEYISYQSSIT